MSSNSIKGPVAFHKDVLQIDCEDTTDKLCSFIISQMNNLRRKGAVIGISGGIDSAVCAALCIKALGKDRVLGLILPERESNPISSQYAKSLAQENDIRTLTIDITPSVECFGAYEKRNEAIKELFPEYNDQYKSKITLPAELLTRDSYNFFRLTIEDNEGNEKSKRLSNEYFQRIIAATNIKQRTRMIYLYYFAEVNDYFVCGTTNRNETIQGFFVKYGDGGVDIEPIASLYKTQIYQLANYLQISKEIITRAPSPDTYSFAVSDEEFYFRIPYDKLDLLLYAWERNIPSTQVCEVMNLTESQVRRAFRDFNSKYKATDHLRRLPITADL